MTTLKVLKEATKYKICILRSEDKIFLDNEIDLVSTDKPSLYNFLTRMFHEGLMIDKLKTNYPHIKLTDFYSSNFQKKEYDIVSDLYFFDKSRCFKMKNNLNGLEIENKSIKGLNFYSLNLYDQYITLLLHSFCDKKFFASKYKNILINQKKSIKDNVLRKKLISYTINYSIFKTIESFIFSSNKIQKYKYLVFIFYVFKQPINFVRNLVRKLIRYLKQNIKRMFNFEIILFMGADGAGKTTVINKLIETLNKKRCHYIHLGNRSNVLPTTKIINYFKKNKIYKNHKNNNKENNFRKLIKSILYKSNFFLEIFTNISKTILLNIFFLRKKYILIDRYIYDRYRIGETLMKYSFFPSPDIIFFLDAEIETLLKRKNEHNKETISFFKKNFSDFLIRQNFSKVIRINTELDINHNNKLILKILENEN